MLDNVKMLMNTRSIVINHPLIRLVPNELGLTPSALLHKICKKILNCYSIVTSV